MAEPVHRDDLLGGTMVAEQADPEPTGGSQGRLSDGDAFEDCDVEADDDDEQPVRASGRRVRRKPVGEHNGRASMRAASPGMNNHYALAERDVLRVGDVVSGKYRVDRVLGRRGSSIVLQGTHIELGQPVTIRHPARDVSRRPNAIARFLRLSRSACQIQSEHAVRILDVGRLDTGVPFLVTEGLNGWDLEEVIRVRGPLPVEDAVEYIVQASEAIAEGHRLGIVHRSLSLSSLVLTRRADGSALVKVLDFGVPDVLQAVPFSEIAGTETEANPFMSALRFLSPEQIRNADEVDARADVWAMGAILHELVTGTPAFFGASPGALLAAVAADPPHATGAVVHGLPPEVESVIVRSLAKDRGARFHSLGEFVMALRAFAPADSVRVVERISRMSLPSRPPPLPATTAYAGSFNPASVPPGSFNPGQVPGSFNPVSGPASAHPASFSPTSYNPASFNPAFSPASRAPQSAPSAKAQAGTPTSWLAVAGVGGVLIGAVLAIVPGLFRTASQPAAPPVAEKVATPEPQKAVAPVVANPASPLETSIAIKPASPLALPTQPQTAAAALPTRPATRAPVAATPAPAAPREPVAIAAKGPVAPASSAGATQKGSVASVTGQAAMDLFDDTR